MLNKAHSTIVSIALWSVAASGFSDPTSRSARAFVLFGGFGSCALMGDPESMNMNDYFDEALADATAGDASRPLALKACYAVGNEVLFHQLEDGEVYRGTRESFISYLQKLAKSHKINLIGQSHGGWTAMVAALKLPTGSVESLITIDPISVEECSALVGFGSSVGGILGLGSAEGCSSFPPDLVNKGEQIKRKAGYWMNAWQSSDEILHSSSTRFAHENLEIEFDEANSTIFGQHLGTETSPQVWNRARQIWRHIRTR